MLVLFSTTALPAQDRLFEQEPFDLVVLNQANDNVVLKVELLDLPGRRVPTNRLPTDKLRLQLFARSGESYEVLWRHVARIEFFEEAILAEADRLVAQNKFDEAYDYYDFLSQNHNDMPRLADSVEQYLMKNAAAVYQAERYDDALSMLLELHHRNPNRSGLAAALNRVADRLIERHITAGDYASARAAIDHFAALLPDVRNAATQKWRQNQIQQAQLWLTKAQTEFAAQRDGDALKAISEARALWPELDGLDALKRQITANRSHILVGVTQRAGQHFTTRLDDWATRRTARLIHRLLFELTGYTTEGGQYECPYGEIQQDDSGLRLSIQLRQGIPTYTPEHSLTGYDVSQKLLELADPTGETYRGAWDDLLQSVSVEEVFRVRIDLNRPHVRPEALLLGVRLDSDARTGRAWSSGPYQVEQRTDQQVRYVSNRASLTDGKQNTNRVDLIEEWFADSDAAVEALQREEIDVVDRISPRQAALLESSSQIVVERYRLPTVHVLIPNAEKPLLNDREFRRALVYGINRREILEEVLLGGRRMSGFTVVSGPFAVGESRQDPIAYATNPQIVPRPYEPSLAITLLAVAARNSTAPVSEVADGKDADREIAGEAAEMRTLVLAHPADAVARAACESIRQQLSIVGIPVRLRELAPDDLATSAVDYDLLYAELMLWEPSVDSRVLLGEDGMTGKGSSYMDLALRKVDKATSWAQVRSQLQNVHRVAHNDVAVIPLWQTVNFFAYRKSLKNVGDSPVSLYQNIEQWDIVSAEQ